MILVPALLRRIGARAALTLMLSLTVALAIPLSSSPARAAVPPFCPGTIDTALLVACAAAPFVADKVDEAASQAMEKNVLKPLNQLGIRAVNNVLDMFVQLWLHFSVFDLEGQGSLTMSGMTLSIGWMIAAMLLMWQSMRTMAMGRATPLLEAGRGLLVTGLVAITGTGAMAFFLEFSDILAEAIMGDLAKDGLLKKELVTMMASGDEAAGTLTVPVTLINLQLAVMLVLALIVQLVVLLMRNASLPLLALVLPIAAAGQVGGTTTRQWLPKVISTSAAIIVYKPAVALIITAAVRQNRDSTAVSGMFYGLLMVVLSLVAMPALMRVFTPFGVAAAGGGGAGILRLAGDALNLATRVGSGGTAAAVTTAADQAQHMQQVIGNQAGASSASDAAGLGATLALTSQPSSQAATSTLPQGSEPSTASAGASAGAAAAGTASASSAAPTIPAPSGPPAAETLPGAAGSAPSSTSPAAGTAAADGTTFAPPAPAEGAAGAGMAPSSVPTAEPGAGAGVAPGHLAHGGDDPSGEQTAPLPVERLRYTRLSDGTVVQPGSGPAEGGLSIDDRTYGSS
ncbi:hypothetical protein OG339_48505 (plasmid) [Streptosporangium sp. NBC_01495]|uniref:hypothetical protein n=1 Tax=Streptosporangium sp. NBC_01495 TaxID=2903899 RepID=UPI002E358AE6|nr:hypothetical protein [Streptosporangium sp. NBC_01495]